MTKYQLVILALIASSIISALLGMIANDKKGLMFQLYRVFTIATLLIVLLLGYRAFFLVR
jgi:hypothetical protein